MKRRTIDPTPSYVVSKKGRVADVGVNWYDIPELEGDGGIDYLSNKYPHVRDQYIRFWDDGHIYNVDWDMNGDFSRSDHITSVTTFTKKNFAQFNEDDTLRTMRRNKTKYMEWRDAYINYSTMDDDDIRFEWEQERNFASGKGSVMHNQIEMMYNGKRPEGPITVELNQFLPYFHEMRAKGWLPFRSEWKLWTNFLYSFVGTIDMLFMHSDISLRRSVSSNGRVVLHLYMVDFKRSKDIPNQAFGNKRGSQCCARFPDCKYFHYSLQLNAYRYILENFYHDITVDGELYNDIVVDTMHILAMHPIERDAYELLTVGDHQDVIKALFYERLSPAT